MSFGKFQPIIHDLSKHHFSDRDGHHNQDRIEIRSEREEVVPQNVGSCASKYNTDKRGVYFDCIPNHRQDPDGYNNDIFYWCDGGNGTSYLHFFDGEQKTGDCRHYNQSSASSGTRLYLEPPPPILILNDVILNNNHHQNRETLQSENESGKCGFDSTDSTKESSATVTSTKTTTSVAMFVTLDDLEHALTKLLYTEFGSDSDNRLADELGLLPINKTAAEPLLFELGVRDGGLQIGLKRSGTSSRTAIIVATSKLPVNNNNDNLLSSSEIEQSHRIVRLIRFLLTHNPPNASLEQLDGDALDVCGIVLGAASRPSLETAGTRSQAGEEETAGVSSEEKSSNGRKKLCLYVAPIKIVRDSLCVPTHPSVNESSTVSVPTNARSPSLLRKRFSVTPARVILFEGAQVDPNSLIDVSHTITHDSPFFPGGQSLLTCPAAVALKRKSMKGATSAAASPQRASTLGEEGNEADRAGVCSSCDVDAPFQTLVGCDVGTHVDSPQHFFADVEHKNIVDLKAHGHLIGSGSNVGSDVSAPTVEHLHDGCHCGKKLNDFSELVVPVVVVDVREQCKADPDYLITVDDIVRAAHRREAEGGALEITHSAATNSSSFDALRGALVVGLTGWGTKFEEATRKRKPEIYQGIGAPNGAMHFPGFSPEAAHFLLNIPNDTCTSPSTSNNNNEKASVSGIGIDTLSLDRGLSEDFHVHQIMLGQGNKYQVENMNLAALPLGGGDDCLGIANNEYHCWYAIVLPAAVHGAFEANARVSFVRFL